MANVYDFTVKDRTGNEVSLKDFEGKVLLIVNTATGCGFTPHYEPLEAMYKDLKDKGFEIREEAEIPARKRRLLQVLSHFSRFDHIVLYCVFRQ